MTNIILPWPGGTPPAPWQKVTGLDGRYLRCTAAVDQALGLGGSTYHEHPVINFVLGYGTNTQAETETGSNVFMLRHNNHTRGTTTGLTATNDPLYQEFELIYMDAAAWEVQERRFPEGAILLSEAVLEWAEVQRYTPCDGRIIKIGSTPGSQGGRSAAGHSVSVALNSAMGPTATYLMGGSPYPYTTVNSDKDHPHPAGSAVNSSQETTMPARIQTRFYQCLVDTIQALQGAICFFDGQPPSANWSIMSGWDGRFIESQNSNATPTGTSSHGHTGLSGTSGAGASNSRSLRKNMPSGSNYFSIPNHAHPWSLDLQAVIHEPEYVNLVAAKLNKTLYHMHPRASIVITC